MPKYTVALRRRVLIEQVTTVPIDASSADEAKLKAVQRAEEEPVEDAAAQTAEKHLRARFTPWHYHHRDTLLYFAEVDEPD
jgi:hypothetical protein